MNLLNQQKEDTSTWKSLILHYLVPRSALVQKLPGLKLLLLQLLQGKVQLVAARRGVVLVLRDHPCSLAVRVVLYLSLPGKATCLEAPEEKRKQIS